jgi:G:T-mismatch repair DNA endonuclease (very short patch repair protein)
MTKTKICTKCKKRKPRNSYYLRNKKRGWIFSECIVCSNKFRKKRKEKELGRKLNSRSKFYSTIELKKLRTLYLSGISYTDLEKKFRSRTRHALESKLSEMGIATRRNYMLKRETNIELIVKQWLKEQKQNFKSQQSISQMTVDLCKEHVVIEVLGSFWHCDKKLYPAGPKYPLQKINIIRDKRRKCILNKLGYSIIYIWEYDIEHFPEETKKALQVVLNSDIWNNDRPISVELLRDNTEITKSITKGVLVS